MKPLLIASCVLLAACAAFLTVRAGAQPAILAANPQFATFGMVGLNTGQTARLNAFALPTGGPLIAGASCQVTFDFYDATGKIVKTGTATVAQGAAVHFDMTRTEADNLSGRSEIRGAVRAAMVNMSATATPVFGYCSVLPTLEIFDTTSGQTTVVLQQTTGLSLVLPM